MYEFGGNPALELAIAVADMLKLFDLWLQQSPVHGVNVR